MRKGMQIVDVENEGPLVFLYDPANTAAIEKSKAAILNGYAPGAADDQALKALFADSMIAIYELPQDDPIRVGVVTGEPLDAKEKKAAKWRKPQTVRLKLPSGKLRVDSYSTLADEKGSVLEVPAGEYELTLHRVDLAAMAGQAYEGPNEVITLTLAKGAAKKSSAGLLEFDPQPRAPWDGAGKVVGGEFQGQVVKLNASFPDGSLSMNLGLAAARKLAWQQGAQLELNVGGATLRALFQGEMNPIQFDAFADDAEMSKLRDKDPALLRAWLDKASSLDELRIPGGQWYRDTKVLRLVGFKGGAPKVKEILPAGFFSTVAGARVTARALEKPLLPPPDLSWQGRWKVADGTLHAEVLLSKPETLWLNVDEASFKQLGFRFEKAGELELTLGPQTRRLIDKSGKAGSDLEAQEAKMPGALEEKPLTIQFRPFLANPKLFVAACDAFFFKKYPLDLPARPGTPVTLRIRPRT